MTDTPLAEESCLTRVSLVCRLTDWIGQPGWQEFFNTYGYLAYGTVAKAGLSDAQLHEYVQETVLNVARAMLDFAKVKVGGLVQRGLDELERKWK